MEKGDGHGRVVIGAAREKVRAACESLAESGGYHIAASYGNGREMLQMTASLGADLALVDGKMEGLDGIQVGESLSATMPVVFILSPKQLENMTVAQGRNEDNRYYVGLHFSKKAILQTMGFALETARNMRALEAEMSLLRDRQQRRRDMNLAKGMLMQSLGLDEHQAHQWLQRKSMDTGRNMEELVEEVLKARPAGGGEEA